MYYKGKIPSVIIVSLDKQYVESVTKYIEQEPLYKWYKIYNDSKVTGGL